MDAAEVPLRELQEELSELCKLRDSRGFKRLMLIAKEQATARKDTLVLTPLKKMNEVLAQEYAKGEVAGILLIVEMTDIQIAALEDEISDKLKEENGDVEKV